MDQKPNFYVNGGIKLPIGYRFHPTDEELVVHYLKRKVLGIPLPASVIPELDDVFQTDPWNLPGDIKEKMRYFFSKNGNVISDKKCKVGTGSGYWKYIGKLKQIMAPGSNQSVGLRKTMVFNEGKRARESKTQWVMHEYHLVNTMIPNSTQLISSMEVGDWVVYSLSQRKRKLKKHGSNKKRRVTIRPSSIDYASEESDLLCPPPPPPQPSSSSNSSTDENLCSNMLDDQEEITSVYNNTFSCMRKH